MLVIFIHLNHQKLSLSNIRFEVINLEIFLHFNKIRVMGVNLKDLRRSIKKSEVLELSKDERSVRRRTPFVELTQKDIDKKTIYVENIPAKITYEQLKDLFEQYGKISYISLPKFKTTNQLKGFAFVEFEQKESSKQAAEV
jgi:La-related protein 7